MEPCMLRVTWLLWIMDWIWRENTSVWLLIQLVVLRNWLLLWLVKVFCLSVHPTIYSFISFKRTELNKLSIIQFTYTFPFILYSCIHSSSIHSSVQTCIHPSIHLSIHSSIHHAFNSIYFSCFHLAITSSIYPSNLVFMHSFIYQFKPQFVQPSDYISIHQLHY